MNEKKEYICWAYKRDNGMEKTNRVHELPDEQHVTIPFVERQTINNREECSKRIAEREQLIQSSVNPLLLNNNYLSDLRIQDKHLRSQNSNFSKVNKKELSK
ncbi:MAG: hypothetical protein CML42_07720 [Rhodobacteraceae bacterium]|nr:hypothetical protein [Paracoccaceae bacterium]|tara:strand:+ start:8441 stop:8746 length:306 start_codon:yes stop_codon:yes gene_type:complete